jgi:DHA2 family multidrug resistance protein-like MFS transporter
LLTPVIVRRVRPASVIASGLAVSAVGFTVLTQVDGASGLAVLVCATVVFSLSLAPVFTLTNDTVIGTAPPERAGAASAISETSSELGGALGIAILGSIGAALYRSAMADAVPPGVPPKAAEAARGTLGGALALATQLPDQLGAAFLGKAREAFTQGLQLTALVSAAMVMVTAILAAGALRRPRSGNI